MGGAYTVPPPPLAQANRKPLFQGSGAALEAGGEWILPDGTRTFTHRAVAAFYRGVRLPSLPARVLVRGVSYVKSEPPHKYVIGWTVDLGNGKSVTIEQDDDTPTETVFAQIQLVVG